MDVTRLNLLTKSGAIAATFEPNLSADQAAQLSSLIRDPNDNDELELLLWSMADYWGLYLTIDR